MAITDKPHSPTSILPLAKLDNGRWAAAMMPLPTLHLTVWKQHLISRLFKNTKIGYLSLSLKAIFYFFKKVSTKNNGQTVWKQSA